MPAPERFGALDFPVPQDAPLGDPSLAVVLAFAEAILNARMGAAWLKGGRAAGDKPVRSTYPHDPTDLAFNNNTLPALFAWRESGQVERIASDYVVDRSMLILCWVFPMAQEGIQQKRNPLVNAAAKLICQGLMRGRDPAWVKAGDTSPRAPTDGSLVWKFAGFWRCGDTKWRVAPVKIEGDDPGIWRGLMVEVPIQERLVDRPAPLLAGAQISLQTKDDPPFVTNTLELEPPP
jgi:hypothetical protein